VTVPATRAEIETRIKAIIADVLDVDTNSLSLTSNLNDELNIGSLELAELLINIDSEFNIHISDEAAQKIHTVGGLIDYIEKNSVV
jgi:acyl carrier protein